MNTPRHTLIVTARCIEVGDYFHDGIVYDVTPSGTPGHTVIAAGWDGKTWAEVIPSGTLCQVERRIEADQ